MLKLTFFEIIVRVFPECFIFIFSTLAFAKLKVCKNTYILSSIVLSLLIPVVRFLPINYGVHVIINLLLLMAVNILINKLEVITAIKSSITLAVLAFLLEGINVFLLIIIFGDNFDAIISNTSLKAILGLPSLFALLAISFKYYKDTNKSENISETV